MFITLMWLFFIALAVFFVVASIGCAWLLLNYHDFLSRGRVVSIALWCAALISLWSTRLLMKQLMISL